MSVSAQRILLLNCNQDSNNSDIYSASTNSSRFEREQLIIKSCSALCPLTTASWPLYIIRDPIHILFLWKRVVSSVTRSLYCLRYLHGGLNDVSCSYDITKRFIDCERCFSLVCHSHKIAALDEIETESVRVGSRVLCGAHNILPSK